MATVGEGPTEISAFHTALATIQLADYNIIRLSSVIPPTWKVEIVEKYSGTEFGAGDRMYCVYALSFAEVDGHCAAALTWSQPYSRSCGYFAEATAGGSCEALSTARLSLRSMIDASRIGQADVGELAIEARPGSATFACSLTIAVYGGESWY